MHASARATTTVGPASPWPADWPPARAPVVAARTSSRTVGFDVRPAAASGDDPRYFTDGRSGNPVYLVGSHTWWNQGDETLPV